jgi:hypothetical protein
MYLARTSSFLMREAVHLTGVFVICSRILKFLHYKVSCVNVDRWHQANVSFNYAASSSSVRITH